MLNNPLTQREHEVMTELVQGKTNKEIAKTLNIKEHTVESHVQNIFRKYGVATRVQAALRYVGHGASSGDA